MMQTKLERLPPNKPFKPSLVLASVARAYLSGAAFMYSPLGLPTGLTRLERLARDRETL
jgi:hypothetical protein